MSGESLSEGKGERCRSEAHLKHMGSGAPPRRAFRYGQRIYNPRFPLRPPKRSYMFSPFTSEVDRWPVGPAACQTPEHLPYSNLSIGSCI
jgi:hypothetical protein